VLSATKVKRIARALSALFSGSSFTSSPLVADLMVKIKVRQEKLVMSSG
jgi:hypothetical protein